MDNELTSKCPKCEATEIAEAEPATEVTCAECRLYHNIWNRVLPALAEA